MSIIERLRGLDTFGYQSQLACEAADLIEQQAERIKELEAERDAERDNCVAVIATYQEQLSALRQRIADAPVVQKSKRQLLSRVEELSLIVKEDLT